MANLAIKSHPTRGEEVVGILSMLGGIQCGYGSNCKGFYFIDDCKNIVAYDNIPKHRMNDFIIFTLEEFLEKFPYKVGDKVIAPSHNIHTIESIHWAGDKIYYNTVGEGFNTSYTAKDLQPYKEKTTDKANKAVFDANAQCCDIMNHLIKEETMEEIIKIDIPKGYEFAGVDDNNQQVVFERIDCQYPKTYEEGCKITNSKIDRHYFYTKKDKEDYPEDVKIMDSLDNLRRLLICRNAYWKIAGDWKPNLDSKQHKFAISNVGDKISFEVYGEYNSILCFPTEEMRDAFYENFKSLIEECKELL